MELNLSLAQKHLLSQQMQQSVKILQMSSQELNEYIKDAAMENPVIDIDDINQISEDPLQRKLEELKWLQAMGQGNTIQYSTNFDNNENDTPLYNQDQEESLYESLMSQISGFSLTEVQEKALRYLIGNLDESGYLSLTNEQLTIDLSMSMKDIIVAGKWNSETKERAYAQLLKTTQNVCAYAKTKGMMVEIEVFDYDIDKTALIGPAPYAAKFAADMRTTCNNFGLIVDLSHFPITYETSKFVIQTLRPYITHLHIGNAVAKEGCEAYGDMHPRFGFPNSANDTAELLNFFRILKEEGFLNAENPYVLSLEVKPWGKEDGDIILANTKRVINRAWALLED